MSLAPVPDLPAVDVKRLTVRVDPQLDALLDQLARPGESRQQLVARLAAERASGVAVPSPADVAAQPPTPTDAPSLTPPAPSVTSPQLSGRRQDRAARREEASRRAVRLASAALACVAVAAAVLSFIHTAAFAVTSGATDPATRWLFPIAIEGSAVAGLVVVWTRRGATRLAWAVVVVAGAVAVWANAAHNPDASTSGRILSALPPLAVIVAVELVASLRDRQTK